LYEKGLSLFSSLVERLSSLKGEMIKKYNYLIESNLNYLLYFNNPIKNSASKLKRFLIYKLLFNTNIKAINLHEKQIQKLDQYITQINTDLSLKSKIEKINLLLTNSSSLNNNTNSLNSLSSNLNNNETNLSTSGLIEKQRQNIDYDLIDMQLIDLRKYIANNVFYWNTKMSEFFKKSKHDDVSFNLSNEEFFLSETALFKIYFISFILKDYSSSENLTSTTPIEIPSFGGKLQTQESSEISSSLNNEGSLLSKSASGTDQQHTPSLFGASANHQPDNDEHSKSVTAMSIGKRLIANLIPSSAYQSLKLPFPEDEHYLLSTESKYFVNDRYLTSIVAFTLSSREYKDFQVSSSKIDLVKLNQQASFSIHSSSNHNQNGKEASISSSLQDNGKIRRYI
jgi:hypothetical protein